MVPAPPLTAPGDVVPVLKKQGYAVVGAAGVCALAGCAIAGLQALQPSWNDLPPDAYLKDGGRYRRRRHTCFLADGPALREVAHRAHWQPVEYNALHGGMQRWFEPMAPTVAAAPAWTGLLLALAGIAA